MTKEQCFDKYARNQAESAGELTPLGSCMFCGSTEDKCSNTKVKQFCRVTLDLGLEKVAKYYQTLLGPDFRVFERSPPWSPPKPELN